MKRRQFEVTVVKSLRRRGGRPLAASPPRAEPTHERVRRAGLDFERGDSGQITMRDSPL